MSKRKIKVGFDLDGVILYNPIRTFRIIARSLKFLKPFFFKQKKDPFYIPQSPYEKLAWSLLHKTSLWPAKGISQIRELVRGKKIEAYLISGRYDFLGQDLNMWMKKIKAKYIFKDIYYNKKNLQPNLFKQQTINRLGLDYYFEDNWDIIERLNQKTKAKIVWISNLLDYRYSYPYKFLNLKQAVSFLEQLIASSKSA